MIRYFIWLNIFFSIFTDGFSTKNILLINSYHPGFTWTDGITSGVKEAISGRPDINLFVEYEDAKRFSDLASQEHFKEYIIEKYRSYKLDLLITSDNNALDFVVKNQLDKKWNVPVVFCGISNFEDYKIENQNYFGILETDDWLPIFDAIIKIHNNDLDRFYFISENSSTGKIREAIIKKCFGDMNVKTQLIFLDNYTVESLLKVVENIKGKSVIYYHGIGVDSYGNPVVPENLGVELARHSNVPVYTSYRNIIGQGVVGGFVRSGLIHGLQTAELALKILDGVDKNIIPKVAIQGGEFVFDYNILKKFNLNLNNFPQDAVFINKPKKILEEYRREVLAILAFILVLFTVIIFLIASYIKRVKAEKKFRESESKFREFAELLPQIVFEIDFNGRFQFVNNHALDKFGFTKEDFSHGISMFDLIAPEDKERVRENISKLTHRLTPDNSVYTVLSKDDVRYLYEIHPTLMLKDGKPVGIRGIGIDITRQKQFEQELIVSRKKAEESDKLKSAFLANMSHEIRTPLNSIVGFSYLLSERNLTEEEIKNMAKYIRTSSDHLLMLINDIIDVSKIEAGQLEFNISNVSISELMTEMNLYMEREKIRCEKEHIKVVFKTNITQNGIMVKTDGLRLKQVLYNLINNALKFTEQGMIEYGYQKQNENIVFYVKDTGIGISDDLGEKVFNRFVKLNSKDGKLYPGFGLGLSISKQLAEMLGGELWHKPNQNGGTIFYFSIPLEFEHEL